MKRLILGLIFTSGMAHAVHFDFGGGVGVKAGFSFTDSIRVGSLANGTAQSVSRGDNYIVGPVVELRLPFGFAVEADGLYHAADYSVATGSSTSTTIKANSWEIPYVAKFRFPIPLLKPFILAGGAYRTFSDLSPDVTPTHNAFVGGLGLELRIGKLRLSGEGRYLRWGEPPENATVRLSRNQGEVLFGIIF